MSRDFSPQARAEILRELQNSGLSAHQFAPQHGVSASMLYWWRRDAKLKEEGSTAATAAPKGVFQQVPLGQVLGASPWVGELSTAEGTVLRWSGQMAPEVLLQLLIQLRRPC